LPITVDGEINSRHTANGIMKWAGINHPVLTPYRLSFRNSSTKAMGFIAIDTGYIHFNIFLSGPVRCLTERCAGILLTPAAKSAKMAHWPFLPDYSTMRELTMFS
jgi:hypothetical protein